jgi:hypothetical protein
LRAGSTARRASASRASRRLGRRSAPWSSGCSAPRPAARAGAPQWRRVPQRPERSAAPARRSAFAFRRATTGSQLMTFVRSGWRRRARARRRKKGRSREWRRQSRQSRKARPSASASAAGGRNVGSGPPSAHRRGPKGVARRGCGFPSGWRAQRARPVDPILASPGLSPAVRSLRRAHCRCGRRRLPLLVRRDSGEETIAVRRGKRRPASRGPRRRSPSASGGGRRRLSRSS